jgi:hypothetical protein
VNKAILVAQFLRTRAWWRLDSAGASALRVARSVVSLLDAAAYLLDLPEDDPDLLALEAMGCFTSGVFDPGPEGANIIRGWQLADEWSAGPRELLAELVRAVHGHHGTPGNHGTPAVSVPQQVRPIQTARSFSAGRPFSAGRR